jgi:hypothetical protein
MGFHLRDRDDGMVEIVFGEPILIGIFPDRDIAGRFRAFLEAGDPPLAEDRETDNGPEEAALDAMLDKAETEAEAAAARAVAVPKLPAPKLPAVVRVPTTVLKKPRPAPPSDEVKAAAFARFAAGEKLSKVAHDLGLGFFELRAQWANHRLQLQRHLTAGGPQPCALCHRPFTPSLSHPDTCARCSRG